MAGQVMEKSEASYMASDQTTMNSMLSKLNDDEACTHTSSHTVWRKKMICLHAASRHSCRKHGTREWNTERTLIACGAVFRLK